MSGDRRDDGRDQTDSEIRARLRALPSVSDLVTQVDHNGLADDVVTNLARTVLAAARRRLNASEPGNVKSPGELLAARIAQMTMPRLRPVINATGIILHTNLGRAPVSVATAAAMAAAASAPVALELDLQTGQRGGRMDELTALMQALTGAEASLVVNNGAAALLLTIASLAGGRDVLVSRGEAVEIGGGFRVPEIVAQSGARLVDVGTTNRTRVDDFVQATTPATAVYLRVHPSNFVISGFTAQPDLTSLAAAASYASLPLVVDLGSGALIDTRAFGLPEEPMVAVTLAAGARIVTFSGDKLIGGPQAGIITGDAALVARIARHPLARALRADKTALAGLAATLRHYLAGDVETSVPVWRAIATPLPALKLRSERLRQQLAAAGCAVRLVETANPIGGGAVPGGELPSVAMTLPDTHGALTARLRAGAPPVLGRLADGEVRFDLRAVDPDDDDSLAAAIIGAVRDAT